MQFNQHGNLEGGIIEVRNLSEIEELLVDNFPTSFTRRRNFESFCNFWNNLDNTKVTRIWLDGSFCSNKLNPNDIDCVVFINPIAANQDYFSNLQKDHKILKNSHLDVYIVPDKNCVNVTDTDTLEAYQNFDYQEKYWQGQFGFDRNRNHKAVIELRKES